MNSPFQQVSCAEICQFANWILQFLMANSQFVIKSKFLVNLPPIFPCFHGQIVKSQGIHGIFYRLIGWKNHPGPSRRTSPCLAVPRRQRTSWGWGSDGWGMEIWLESTEILSQTDFWPPGIHHEFGGVSHHKYWYPSMIFVAMDSYIWIYRIQSTP